MKIKLKFSIVWSIPYLEVLYVSEAGCRLTGMSGTQNLSKDKTGQTREDEKESYYGKYN